MHKRTTVGFRVKLNSEAAETGDRRDSVARRSGGIAAQAASGKARSGTVRATVAPDSGPDSWHSLQQLPV